MRFFIKIFIILTFFLVSCVSLKYKGSFYNKPFKYVIDNNDHEFLISLKYDSIKKIDLKLFDKSGIKILESFILKDSCHIKYCIDESFNNLIVSKFEKINKEIDIYELINQLNFGFNLRDKNKFHLQFDDVVKVNCIELNSFNSDQMFKICSNSWTIKDSVLNYKNIAVYFNDQKVLLMKRIND
jgi:hypothetical protein